jgi:hypothetical protein
MKLIAHRGNINGPNPKKENNTDYINKAIESCYDVEIDVCLINNKWYLGHNNPEYEIKYNFLFNSRFWLHAKNGEVFDKLLKDKNYNFNVFWHTTEDWVLTSKKYIWTYPNKKLFVNSICVLPELGYKDDLKLCYGICSDYVEKHKLESTKDLQI